MLFSSVTFIVIFLPVTLLVYFLVPIQKKNLALLAASLAFYAWGEPVYVILLLLSVTFNYLCGRDIEEKRGQPSRARRSLILAIVVNLLILGFFKYYGLLMETLNAVLPTELLYRNLAVPIGISFFTLRALSYLIDVYRGQAPAQKNYVNLALYIGMFPQMPAGPIEQYADMESQLQERNVSIQRIGSGAMLFITGLAKKVILADSAGMLHEQVSSLGAGTFSAMTAWLGCIAFAFQIYYEFSGYADMAVGLGRMFGFDLKRNFNYPYISRNITEFWKRWNISVASWFQNYVYAPLGGNECAASRNMLNLFVMGALTGFWYGAKWTLLWWGVYAAALLILERYVWGRAIVRLPKIVQHIYAFVLVLIGWVFFFSPDMGEVGIYIRTMFGMGASALVDSQAASLIATHWLLFVLCVLGASSRGLNIVRSLIDVFQTQRGQRIAGCVIYIGIFVISLAFLVTGGFHSYLYAGF